MAGTVDLGAPALAARSPEATRLLVLYGVRLAWVVVQAFAAHAIATSNEGATRALQATMAIGWLALAVGEATLLGGYWREVRPHPAARQLGVAVVLAAITAFVAGLETLHTFGGPAILRFRTEPLRTIWDAFYWARGLGLDVALWLALEGLVPGKSFRDARSLRDAFYGFRLAAGALAAIWLLPADAYRPLLHSRPFLAVYPWLRVGLQVAWSVPVLVVLRALSKGSYAEPGAREVRGVAIAPRTGSHDLVVGGLWLAGGLLVTTVTFALAENAGGGHYVVSVGPIAYGLVRIARGLAR
jgi:hypothetical protein